MSSWTGGYVADVSYTKGFYREITPAWLAFSSLLLGHRPPDLARPFRYAELGCGHGFTPTIAAACHPQAEFWGFDFNPAHIEGASHLAAGAGLSNIRFQEASFADLADAPDAALPQFDMIVMHGIWSWVSAEQRAHLVRFIRRRLAPGGLVYNSYNTMAGWVGMLPMQRLMRAWIARSGLTPHEAAPSLIAYLQELCRSDAVFFKQNAAVVSRVEQVAQLDPRYFVHEYLNATWEPATFDRVAAELEEARCGYIGSATLVDNMDAVAVPPGAARLIGRTADPVLREMLRDLGASRAFRRDLFRRGTDQPLPGEHMALLDAIAIAALPRDKEKDKDLQIATGIGSVTPRPEIYSPVLERLNEGPLGMAELRAMPALREQPMAEALQVVGFLTAGGLAHPCPAERPAPAALAATRGLNLQIGRNNANGANTQFLASPLVASGISIDPVEAILLPRLSGEQPPHIPTLVGEVIAALRRTNRAVMRDGVVVADPEAARATMTETVTRILEQRVPLLRRLAVLPEAG